jgi:hypothetical protein
VAEHSNLLHSKLQDFTVTKRQLQQNTIGDRLLSQVIAFMERGWPVNTSTLPKDLHTYFEKQDELSFDDYVLLWKGWIVVPDVLREGILQILHEGHPSICSMKELAKFYVWWPHVDDDIEHLVASCSACQEGRPREAEEPLFS